MQKNNLKPNKLLGQNFLRDKNILRKMIAAAQLTKNDVVLEVGPGEGTLTEELARAAGRVLAVEKDKALAAQLKIKFQNHKNVEIIENDILEFINHNPCFANHRYKVVANIPYYLTSHLIRLLLESDNPPRDIVLMVQKEVAQRICARPPKMSLLAAATQFYATPKIIAKVPSGAFWPRPKVDSAIIKITPRDNSFPLYKRGTEGDLKNAEKIHPRPPFTKEGVAHFFTVLRAGFSQPRKQLLNNLSEGLKIEKKKIAGLLEIAGLKPDQRAETLSVADWEKLANAIPSKKPRT